MCPPYNALQLMVRVFCLEFVYPGLNRNLKFLCKAELSEPAVIDCDLILEAICGL